LICDLDPRVDAATPGAAYRVTRMLAELPELQAGRPPTAVRLLRRFGVAFISFVLVANVFIEPRPALDGDGLWVALALLALAVGLVPAVAHRPLPPGRRLAALLVVAAASLALTALHPDGGAVVGIYIVVIIAALRIPRPVSWLLVATVVVAETVVLALTAEQAEGAEFAFLASVIPWFFVMTLIRQLQESRAAQIEAAAAAERGRLARDMHDVLAHSLSALALQLEATRLLARDRGADAEVVGAVERAHRLAAGGLDEARRAIAALRGDELPGPERLRDLTEAFAGASDVECDLRVDGDPRALGAEAAMAVYRTAQEALTNVRRHSGAERVAVELAYGPDDVRLVVHDDGRPEPVAASGGYGLTGMRERAELLGGRLQAGPADRGFRVELWLPA
jgi:signal transduction histidine kinase